MKNQFTYEVIILNVYFYWVFSYSRLFVHKIGAIKGIFKFIYHFYLTEDLWETLKHYHNLLKQPAAKTI